MIGPIARAGLLWPTLLSVVGLAILIGLGSWQLVRKAEKETLIARIEARHAGSPSDLQSVLASGSADAADYQRVSATGTFVPGKARFYYAPQPRLGPGYDIYQPLKYAPGAVVWVNRGYIPQELRDAADLWKAPEGEVTVTGTARLPAEPGTFTPDNDLKRNVWYWRDVAGMHASAFAANDGITAAPVFLVAEPDKTLSDVEKAHAQGGPWPKRGISEIVVRNRHLEYALTWYGLGLTLFGVYTAFAWTRLRNVRARPVESR